MKPMTAEEINRHIGAVNRYFVYQKNSYGTIFYVRDTARITESIFTTDFDKKFVMNSYDAIRLCDYLSHIYSDVMTDFHVGEICMKIDWDYSCAQS